MSGCNGGSDVCSTWEGDESPQHFDCFFIFWWGEGDQFNTGVEGAEYGDGCKVTHPDKSDNTTSATSKKVRLWITVITKYSLLKLNV